MQKNYPFSRKKKIVAVFEKPEDKTYIYWRYDDGEECGAYNLMYQTDAGGIQTLKAFLEEAMQADKGEDKN